MKRKQTRFSTRSRGYLMLDMMIVMTLTMVVISIASVWVYKTMLYSANINQRDSHARNISRIGRQIRIDAREANSITVNNNLLTIGILNQNNIEYSIDTNSINRKLETGNQTHQDRFEFASNAKLEWETEESSDAVSLNIKRDFSHLSASKDVISKRLDAQIRIRTNVEKAE